MRATGSGGGVRERERQRDLVRQPLEQGRERGVRRGRVQRLQVVEDEHEAARPPLRLDAARPRAATEACRHAGSLSWRSSVTHANGRSSRSAQSHSSVVLP